MLSNPKSPEAEHELVDIEKAARDLGREIQIFNASQSKKLILFLRP